MVNLALSFALQNCRNSVRIVHIGQEDGRTVTARVRNRVGPLLLCGASLQVKLRRVNPGCLIDNLVASGVWVAGSLALV